MGRIVAVFNQKGGVAKTATINNLAFELNARGKKVLMIDADQQENLSVSVGVVPRRQLCTIFDLLCMEIEDRPYKKDLSDAIVHTEYGVDIIPGSVQMATMDKRLFAITEFESPLEKFLDSYKNDYSVQEKAEEIGIDDALDRFIKLKAGYDNTKTEFVQELCKEGFMTKKDGDLIFKKILSSIRSKYDYILIDCPPALSSITENILNAADRVLVPMTLEPFAASGLSHLITSVNAIQQSKNPGLKFSGLLYAMVDNNLILSKEIKEQAKFFDNFLYIYKTSIPRSTDVNKAFAERIPLIEYNKNNAARLAYSEFCDEFLEREADNG